MFSSVHFFFFCPAPAASFFLAPKHLLISDLRKKSARDVGTLMPVTWVAFYLFLPPPPPSPPIFSPTLLCSPSCLSAISVVPSHPSSLSRQHLLIMPLLIPRLLTPPIPTTNVPSLLPQGPKGTSDPLLPILSPPQSPCPPPPLNPSVPTQDLDPTSTAAYGVPVSWSHQVSIRREPRKRFIANPYRAS